MVRYSTLFVVGSVNVDTAQRLLLVGSMFDTAQRFLLVGSMFDTVHYLLLVGSRPAYAIVIISPCGAVVRALACFASFNGSHDLFVGGMKREAALRVA